VDSDSLLKYGAEEETEPDVNIKQSRSSPRAEHQTQKKITDAFLGSGILLSGQAVGVIGERNIKPDQIISLAREKGVFLVTKEFVEEFFPQEEKEEYSFVIRKGKPAVAAQTEANLSIDKEKDITGNSTSEGKVENFVELFRDRYKRLKSILMNRVNLKDPIDIENLEKYRDQQVKIIGMIKNLRRSKKGNQLIEIEDTTGSALVVDSSEAGKDNTILVNDEVIGVIGTVKGELVIAREIIEPDIPMSKQDPDCEDPISMAFLSDVHVGSLLFKEREFQRFIEWLNLSGSGNRRDVAQSVKYLFIAGDLVDGIGIYPGQENELAIPDIYKQYNYFSRLIEQVPDYIEIIIAAGNHDAVRRVEPQPSLAGLLEPLSEQPNVHMVGNPARVKVHGYVVLMYHGTSMDAMISSLSHLSYDKPEKAQVEYLKKRHLSPIYGTKEQIAPEEKDYMVVDFVPDIFHCGHVHKNGYMNYRGVKVINSGTWQAQTDYQQQQGHIPTPCQVPIYDMRAHKLNVVNFSNSQ
jgi:DNA polymerase II small subunit